MLTKNQKHQHESQGYDIVFEKDGQAFTFKSKEVKNWDSAKQESFYNDTGLKLFIEADGNPVFYDPEYFEIATGSGDYLHYISMETENIPQPINCHSMQNMFADRKDLQSLDLSNWGTNKVTDMTCTFYNCTALQSLNISNWDVSNVIWLDSTFYGCESLQSLNISNWNVSKVASMGNLFYGCKSLHLLDLSHWKLAQATNADAQVGAVDIDHMFDECDLLQKTYGLSGKELSAALEGWRWPEPACA